MYMQAGYNCPKELGVKEGVASILSNCNLWLEKGSVLLAFTVEEIFTSFAHMFSMAWNFFNYFKLFFFAPTQSAEERKRKSQHYRPTQGFKIEVYGGSNFKRGFNSVWLFVHFC
jgi:hypothetical protein